jgi:integrase
MPALTPTPTPSIKLPRGIFIKDPRTGVFWIRYVDAAGKLHREIGGSTITKASAKLAMRHTEKINRTLPKIKGAGPVLTQGEIMLHTLVDDAIKATAILDSSYDLAHKFERIRDDFGTRTAASITQDEIVEWLDQELEDRGWKPASWNRYQAAWSTLYRVAVKSKKVTLNPAAGIPKHAENNSRVRFLTRAEEVKLIAKISEIAPHYVPILELKLHSAMRTSELKRSVVGDHSTETGMLTVHQRKNRNAPPIRHVPLDPIGVNAYNTLATGKKPGELLYPMEDGGKLPQDFGWLTDAAVAAGVLDFTPHDCRHTAASRWVMAGVPLAVVSKFLGHVTTAMTMRYSHLQPENRDQAIAAMMSYYEPKGKKKASEKRNSK